MINIFVANLDFGITSEDLKASFSQFGEVQYAHVVYDKKTKKSKGYGYVEMPNDSEAIAAIEALNGLVVEGRALDIKVATPKEHRQPKEEKEKPKKTFQKKRDFQVRTVNEGEKRRVLRPRRKRNNED